MEIKLIFSGIIQNKITFSSVSRYSVRAIQAGKLIQVQNIDKFIKKHPKITTFWPLFSEQTMYMICRWLEI